MVTIPAGVAPAGSATGELGSSVRVPPLLMAKAPTVSTRLSFTYSVRPSGLTLGSVRANPGRAADNGAADERQGPVRCDLVARDLTDPVFTANRSVPLGVMATQCEPSTCACAASYEGRPRKRCERTVEVTVETADRVRTGRIVIEIDMADDRRRPEPERRCGHCFGCTSANGSEKSDAPRAWQRRAPGARPCLVAFA